MGRAYSIKAKYVGAKLNERSGKQGLTFQISKDLFDELEKLPLLIKNPTCYKTWYSTTKVDVEIMRLAPDLFGNPDDQKCYLRVNQPNELILPIMEKDKDFNITFEVAYFSTKDLTGFSASLKSIN